MSAGRHAHFVPLTKEARAVAVANGATVTALCGERWAPLSTDLNVVGRVQQCETCLIMARTAWVL